MVCLPYYKTVEGENESCTDKTDVTIANAIRKVMEKKFPEKRLLVYVHVRCHGDDFKQSSFYGLWDSARAICDAIPGSRWGFELSNEFMPDESGGIGMLLL